MDMLTSKILFFCPSLTLPAKQQWAKAFWIICLFDFALGSLYNLGPAAKKCHSLIEYCRISYCTIWVCCSPSSPLDGAITWSSECVLYKMEHNVHNVQMFSHIVKLICREYCSELLYRLQLPLVDCRWSCSCQIQWKTILTCVFGVGCQWGCGGTILPVFLSITTAGASGRKATVCWVRPTGMIW